MARPAMDTASLFVQAFHNQSVKVCMRSLNCYECDPICLHKDVIEPGQERTFTDIDTKYGTEVTFQRKNDSHIFCSSTFDSHQQRGYYQISLDKDCSLTTIMDPENPYTVMLWAFLVYFGLSFLWILSNVIYKYRCQSSDLERALISDLGSPDDPTGVYHLSRSEEVTSQTSPTRRRLRSLDAFRGLSIVLMIFVENGGGSYRIFEHSRWNGLTLADLVFPWFMWIMGVSSALSIHSLLRKAVPKRKIFFKILKRSILLIILGLLLNTKKGCDFNTIRIMGVLQRFGITYFIVSTLELVITHVPDPCQVSSSRWELVKDLRSSWVQWTVISCFVIAHEVLTFCLPVPGCPKGYLGPGGYYNHSSHYNCSGGAAGYIDQQVLGKNHMYKSPTFKKIYGTDVPYDPEGILGTFTATFMVFLGLQAGKILIVFVNHRARVFRWVVWAVILGAIATILCEGQRDTGWIPVNKNLWSLSFVLVLASLANILLAFCYILIDMKSMWSGAPFIYPGMNAIVLYLGMELTKHAFPFGWFGCEEHGCYLGEALWGTTLWVIISAYMHYINFFISI